MSRTYIGPFGRILPILDGKEPEQQQFPIDETRTNMTTYQLPPPERLQFGSDTSPGFTEPIRYNTLGQSKKSSETASPVYSEQPKPFPHEQLPPVRQLFFPPSSHIQAPQYPRRQDGHSSQRRSRLPSATRSVPDQLAPVPQYVYHGGFPQAALPPHIQTSTSTDPRREDLVGNPSIRQPQPSQYNPNQDLSAASYPLSYPAYSGRPPQVQSSVAHQTQHALPANLFQSHQSPSLDAHQPQRVTLANIPNQYHERHHADYDMSSALSPDHRKSAQAAENNIRPMARVVGDADVPGQGPSWVYEDGTTCKKVIDGEEVNAQWGVTKAGKPRKRLAVACTTCREKKIKCDPAEPKCVQCEKFGRECKFTTALRNQRNSPETPSYYCQARTPPISIKLEPSIQPGLPLDSLPVSTEDQTLLKRRTSSPQVTEIKMRGTGNAKYGGQKRPLKTHRSSLSVALSSKVERKLLLLKHCTQEAAGLSDTQPIHKEIESNTAFNPVAPLLSAKAELKIVDKLKARRGRLLRAINQKCEDKYQGEMKPCSIMLRLEIMHEGYIKPWVK